MFEKYDAYKDSGVKWLGEIPAEWSIKPGLVAFFESKRSNKGMVRNTVLSLSYGKIIIKPEEKLVGLVPESFETYQLVEPSNIIIRCTDLQNDQTSLRTGLAKDAGIITSAYLNLKVKSGFSSKYLHYYLHALDTTKVLYKFGSGLRQNLSFLDFKRLPILNIPLVQQNQIACFLEQKTTEIDQAIAIKEQQIALLNERKQIVIQKAVTQGLDPNVPMKDSGVEWIGEIPEHWEIMKLKYLISKLESGVSVNASESESASEKDIGVLKTSAVYKYIFDPNENKKVFKNEIRRVSCPVKAGSIIVSRMNAPDLVGASGYVEKDYINLYLPDRLWQARFHTSDVEVPRFVSHILVTKGIRSIIESLATGSSPSMKNISKNDFLNIEIPLPPVNEILELNSFIRDRDFEYIQSIELFKNQIEKLKEYKTTLINDAVTGKIKVA